MTNSDNRKKYPEGHFVGLWMGISIAIATAVWIPISILLDQIALIGIGPALGAGIGVAIGTNAENNARKEGLIRPRENRDNKKSQRLIIAGVFVLLLMVLLGLFFLLK